MLFIIKRSSLCILTIALILGFSFAGCEKKAPFAGDTYSEAPKIPVVFTGKYPSPREATAGEIVTFQVKGLKSVGSFKFYINQIEAEVVNYTDSLITAKVPLGVSTGPVSVVTNNGQVFFGPKLTVLGKVYIDPDFKAGLGTNGLIGQLITNRVSGDHTLVGFFTDYKGNNANGSINGFLRISATGSYTASSSYKGLNSGMGLSLLPLNSSNSSFLVGGNFGSYNIRNVSNVTRIAANGALDTMVVDLINPDPEKNPTASKDTVPSFNGYVGGTVIKLFRDNGKNVIIGNFAQYYTHFYKRAQKGFVPRDITFMNNFLRADDDGVLDSTYNFNPTTGRSYNGINGSIEDALQLSNGTIIIYGNFSQFNGVPAKGIAALNSEGGLHTGYASAFGSGANGPIVNITFNKVTKKMLVTGRFTQFNGHAVNGMVMLNEDGTLDNTFKVGVFGEGFPNFAGQLDNGLIIVSGNFNTYDNYLRLGFMILNASGKLAENYNNTGEFTGVIRGFSQVTSLRGKPAVLLYGLIDVFDNTSVGNLVQIIVEP